MLNLCPNMHAKGKLQHTAEYSHTETQLQHFESSYVCGKGRVRVQSKQRIGLGWCQLEASDEWDFCLGGGAYRARAI